jgi:hypothetical protein
MVTKPVSAVPPTAGFIGQAESSVAGCPYIAWRLARHDNGEITGIAYYSDMSGVSMVTGTMNQAGQFHLTLTSSMGNGPVATVTGTKVANGNVDGVMKGEGCANMKMHFVSLANLNVYNTHGASGSAWPHP